MKKLLTCIALLAISLTAFGSQQTDSAVIHHALFLTITPKTSKVYLDSVSSACKAGGIILSFTTLKYKHGQLAKVEGSVSTQWKKNVSGTFSSKHLKSIEIQLTDKPSIVIAAK